jgi:type IV pilus assembly protein PilC
MPYFTYLAVDAQGRKSRGNLSAANEADLEQRLRRIGLDLVTLRPIDARTVDRGAAARRDLITFCFHLEQITRAGIPLLDGLRDLRDGMDNVRFRDVLTAVLEDMEGGRNFSQALASHPAVFGAVFVSLIRAGEQTGNLETILESLAATLKWQDELAAKTKRLLIYPALVLVLASASILFLMIYLVPQVTTLVAQLGATLPAHTRGLLWLSAQLTEHWLGLLGLLALAVAGYQAWLRTDDKAQDKLDALTLRAPLVGPVLHKMILARFAHVFALMYRSGVSVLDALKIGEDIAGNRVVSAALRRAGAAIGSGSGLTEAFARQNLFPPLVLRMLRVGEATGALDRALSNVAYFYDREIDDSVERGLKLLEPALTALLGLIMAAILFSVLVPLYDVIGGLQL